MKTLSHRTGRIAARREIAAAQTRRENIAPLTEHIHGERKPAQKIFLSYRSPWRGYYYSKSGRMKGGIAARAISGSGWNWYMTKGKTSMVFKRHESPGLSAIAKERNEQQNARSVNIDIGIEKASCAKRAETRIGAGSTDSARTGIRTENRIETRTGNSEIRIGDMKTTNTTIPAAHMSGRSEAPKTEKNGNPNSSLTVSGNVSSDTRNARTESGGSVDSGKEASPSQAGLRSERVSGVFASGEIVVKLPSVYAAVNVIRTIPNVASMVFGFVSGQSQRTDNASTSPIQAATASQDAKKTDSASTIQTQTRAESANASTRTETMRTGGAFIAVRMPEFRPMRIRKGPGYISSWQRKTAQLKTAQGAAATPE